MGGNEASHRNIDDAAGFILVLFFYVIAAISAVVLVLQRN